MADLITPRELALWTQSDEAEVAIDPWAIEVMEKVSMLARFLGGQPWELADVPFDVRMVVIQVAKRTYANPDQEVSSNIGPIGSRVLDAAALLTNLTEAERATLTKYNAEGDPNSDAGLWVMSTAAPNAGPVEAVLYVPDDSLSDWYIPMFSPGDPGDPALYPEE